MPWTLFALIIAFISLVSGVAYYWEDISESSSYAILLSALIAAIGTIIAVRMNRRIASRQATINMLMSNQLDSDYIEAHQVFSDLTKEKGGLESLYKKYLKIGKLKSSGKWSKLAKKNRKPFNAELDKFDHVITVLNGYELIAIGIREGIYDEAIFKRWFRGNLIRDWNNTKIFIEHLRGYGREGAKAKAFIEFDDLASKWNSEGPLERKQRHFRLWAGKHITIHSSH